MNPNFPLLGLPDLQTCYCGYPYFISFVKDLLCTYFGYYVEILDITLKVYTFPLFAIFKSHNFAYFHKIYYRTYYQDPIFIISSISAASISEFRATTDVATNCKKLKVIAV
jgi:hypothetical protein